MNFSFSEFLEAVKDCRQMNTDFNGGKISLDAAVALYNDAVSCIGLQSIDAVFDYYGLTDDPNLVIWTECESCYLASEAAELGYTSVLEYVASFPDRFRVAPQRWLLRCE